MSASERLINLARAGQNGVRRRRTSGEDDAVVDTIDELRRNTDDFDGNRAKVLSIGQCSHGEFDQRVCQWASDQIGTIGETTGELSLDGEN